MRICISVGHGKSAGGGYDSGAVGEGFHEFRIARKIGFYIAEALKKDEEIGQLQEELNEAKSGLAAMRNELCYLCGKYREAHNGACDGCRWENG